MASNLSTVEYISEQIESAGVVRYKKMFGEYMIYCDEKPVFLLCDDMLFVKILPQTEALLGVDGEKAPPYSGAKPHFVVPDIDNGELLVSLASVLAKILPLPAKKKK
ncbi:MAG: TfoX/Sxy family protein [Clostridiales bacterium]|jgi:TfoX/Sxy family transcriptional regulator of competence genes|nr:TfoX/Sxy family protein [Clostridiales bacterium]